MIRREKQPKRHQFLWMCGVKQHKRVKIGLLFIKWLGIIFKCSAYHFIVNCTHHMFCRQKIKTAILNKLGFEVLCAYLCAFPPDCASTLTHTYMSSVALCHTRKHRAALEEVVTFSAFWFHISCVWESKRENAQRGLREAKLKVKIQTWPLFSLSRYSDPSPLNNIFLPSALPFSP